MTTQEGIRRAVLLGAGAAVFAGGAFTGVHSFEVAQAAGPVAKYVMTPTPIGTPATVGPNTRVIVTVIAEDATGAAVPSSPIYVTFVQSTGGGSATVGTTGLGRKAQSFTADTLGKVVVTFTTPATMPTTGTDLLRAENAATLATSTIVAKDTFDYSTISGLSFSPEPIAGKGKLAPNTTVQITLTVTKGTVPAPGATVYMSIKAATGGGSATANGTALTSTDLAVTADSAGLVHIAYKTPATNPTTGVDVLVAADAAGHPAVIARDRYTY